MASNWLRLDTKGMFVGWTSELPGEQYAAWIKFLQVVKSTGGRNGTIQKSYFNDAFLGRYNISRNALTEMLKKAKTDFGDGAAVTETLLEYIVNSWNVYQLDPTAKDRKKKQRDSTVTDVTVSHGCHEDVTGRDSTGRDETPPLGFDDFWEAWPDHSRKEKKGKCREKWKKEKLDRMAGHIIAVVEVRKTSKNWTKEGGQYVPGPLPWLRGRAWDCDLAKVKAAIAREKSYGKPGSTPPPSNHDDGIEGYDV